MKFGIGALLALCGLTVCLSTARAERTFQIIPQVGLTVAHLASEPDSIATNAKVGYMLGGALRFGARPFIQPGLYYQRTTIEGMHVDNVTSQTFEDNLGVSSFWVPVQVGFNIINEDALDVHINGGGTATIVTSVADNEFGIDKDDYKSVIWGFVFGAGVDFAVLSLDASYELGLSEVFEEGSDTKQNVFRFAAGLRL